MCCADGTRFACYGIETDHDRVDPSVSHSQYAYEGDLPLETNVVSGGCRF
jgi:hypothetical protein